MMKKLRKVRVASLAAAAAALFSSCAYDPYYSSGYVDYGYGYGYGGSTFSTATFVSTGNPRWGYDPYVRAYYDYNRRAYYDPYLYGYYPVGYRPVIIHTVPHPYGWRPGRTRIAPPSRITNVTLRDYHDRHGAYRRTNYSWARQLPERPSYDRGGRSSPARVAPPSSRTRAIPSYDPRRSQRIAPSSRTREAPRTAPLSPRRPVAGPPGRTSVPTTWAARPPQSREAPAPRSAPARAAGRENVRGAPSQRQAVRPSADSRRGDGDRRRSR